MADRDSKQRFGDRVRNYSRFRPDYPSAIGEILLGSLSSAGPFAAADIGSGTGIFSRLLLEFGLSVIGVEPNTAMRKESEGLLSRFPGFQSIDGEAGKTGIADSTVDIVSAAQAFHWFSGSDAIGEFNRILKPTGLIALVWNDRKTTGDPFHEQYESLLQTCCPEYRISTHKHYSDESLTSLFEGWDLHKHVLQNSQELTYEGFRGRLESSSYCPKPQSSIYVHLLRELEDLFDRHSNKGLIQIDYSTELFLFKNCRNS